MTSDKKCGMVSNSKVQQAFLDYCREIGYGIIDTVIVKDGEPVMVKSSEKHIKFD